MIVNTESISWQSGWGNKTTSYGIRYLLQCDNTECNKQFYRSDGDFQTNLKRRKAKEIRQPKSDKDVNNSLQYCNRNCQATHFVGVCSKETCEEPITRWKQVMAVHYGTQDTLCTRHSNHRRAAERKVKLQKELYDLLGNKCACCGEEDEMYLEIDHVNNDGSQHRKQRKQTGGPKMYLDYLKDNPNGLQLLCTNCNKAKSRNGGELYIPSKWTIRRISK
tara:strand:- start:400 stop:1059 length:660 start_codon:yes stop_codon:yes gene_type:complete